MKIAVHTKTQEEYDMLMEAYKKEKWQWWNGGNPKDDNIFCDYGKETCVGFNDVFGYCRKEYYESYGYTIISTQEALKRLKGEEVKPKDEIKIIQEKIVEYKGIQYKEGSYKIDGDWKTKEEWKEIVNAVRRADRFNFS